MQHMATPAIAWAQILAAVIGSRWADELVALLTNPLAFVQPTDSTEILTVVAVLTVAMGVG